MRIIRSATLAAAVAAITLGGFAGSAGAQSQPQSPVCPSYVEADDDYPIRLCDKGPHVRRIQQLLNEHGGVEYRYGYLVVDGYFGPNTERAVRALQADLGLAVDGLVGPRTWRALSADLVGGSDRDGSGLVDPWELGTGGGGCAGYTLNHGTYPIDHCDSGLAVWWLQYTLFNWYGYGIEIDGYYGRATESTVTDFQRRWGLPATGVADEATFRAIVEPMFGRGQDIDGDGVIEPFELVPAD